jgi:uncharacterized membrane protein
VWNRSVANQIVLDARGEGKKGWLTLQETGNAMDKQWFKNCSVSTSAANMCDNADKYKGKFCLLYVEW